MFSEKVMKALASLKKEVNVLDHKDDLDTMTETNWKTELRKDEENRRTKDTVRNHTAIGLGAELALHSTGLFIPTSKITKDAIGLTFSDRKKDVLCEEKLGEVKTMNGKWPTWYISKNQYKSVSYSIPFTEFFLIVAYEQLMPLKYRYRPRYLIDSKSILSYIIDGTAKSKYQFDHRKAIAAGKCIDLWSVA